MNRNEHKARLQIYRPADSGAADFFAESADEARRDPELRRFMEAEQALDAHIRRTFSSVRPPAGLRDRILEARTGQYTAESPKEPQRLLAFPVWATAVAAILVLGLVFLSLPSSPEREVDRDGPVAIAHLADNDLLDAYHLETLPEAIAFVRENSILASEPRFFHNDFQELVHFIRREGAPTPIRLPNAEIRNRGYGCNALKIDDVLVGMISFRIEDDEYQLFTIERENLPSCREIRKPSFHVVEGEVFATWTCSGQIHILRTRAPEKNLKALLEI